MYALKEQHPCMDQAEMQGDQGEECRHVCEGLVWERHIYTIAHKVYYGLELEEFAMTLPIFVTISPLSESTVSIFLIISPLSGLIAHIST